jgi:hypothetical protein
VGLEGLTHNVGAIGDCFITLCRDLFILQFAANVLSSGVPLIRFHGGGFGLAVFSWLLQDVQTLTHWAVPGTDLGDFADPGTHTPDQEFKHFQLHHFLIDCLLHMSAREHTDLSLVC